MPVGGSVFEVSCVFVIKPRDGDHPMFLSVLVNMMSLRDEKL